MATLSEVARKGRRFRRPSDPDNWYWLEGMGIRRTIRLGGEDTWSPNAEEIVAMDWESEPLIAKVTAKDLLECALLISKNPITHQRKFSVTEMAKLFIEELGLDD